MITDKTACKSMRNDAFGQTPLFFHILGQQIIDVVIHDHDQSHLNDSLPTLTWYQVKRGNRNFHDDVCTAVCSKLCNHNFVFLLCRLKTRCGFLMCGLHEFLSEHAKAYYRNSEEISVTGTALTYSCVYHNRTVSDQGSS